MSNAATPTETRRARREKALAAKRAELFAACSSNNAEPMTPAEIVALLKGGRR